MKKNLRKMALVAILFLACSHCALSQEKYRVKYNYSTEELGYFLLDSKGQVLDTLIKPKFKRGSHVEIKLINVNPFAMDIKPEVKETTLHQDSGQGFNFGSLLGGISSITDGGIDMNTTGLPMSSLFLGKGESSRGPAMSDKLSELNDLRSEIEAIRATLISNLLNPNLSKDEILDNLKEVASKYADIRLPDPRDNFYLYLAKLERVLIEDANELEGEILALEQDLEANDSITQVLSRGQLSARASSFTNIQKALQGVRSSTTASSRNINEVKGLYSSLENASFEHVYDYYIEDDAVNIDLKFVQSKFAIQHETDGQSEVLKSRNIRLESKGGFKINTSVAFTLNNFGEKSKDFFVDESGVVGELQNDHFVPNLSTMINFYPMLSKSFNLGGSFGLSIPITDQLKGVNFLIGPSLILGNNSRLSLSGGLAFGPVSQLTNGVETGDEVNFTDVDTFTRSVYDLGYFFGISFNVFELN